MIRRLRNGNPGGHGDVRSSRLFYFYYLSSISWGLEIDEGENQEIEGAEEVLAVKKFSRFLLSNARVQSWTVLDSLIL